MYVQVSLGFYNIIGTILGDQYLLDSDWFKNNRITIPQVLEVEKCSKDDEVVFKLLNLEITE